MSAAVEPVPVQDPLAFRSLTILPGKDKAGQRECFEQIVLCPGDLIALVGPTGSGKSRLLADIEWLARGDTPSQRRVLLDGQAVAGSSRYELGAKLVAQLSQTMAFMVDLTVAAFLQIHAESRGYPAAATVVDDVLSAGNALAGEPFTPATPLSRLSGGQSRALMIADTAILCQSPIVLIDEIENAGIDRRRALELLLSKDKLVIMATHDPLLALRASRRLVIGNGGVAAVQHRTPDELKLLERLESAEQEQQLIRQRLRTGTPLLQ